MIITSMKKLEPNKVYTEKDFNLPFEMKEVMYSQYRFLVIRECSLEEYRDHLNETYSKDLVGRILNYEFFYEIHAD